jgi:hypothetical protein
MIIFELLQADFYRVLIIIIYVINGFGIILNKKSHLNGMIFFFICFILKL